MKKIFTLSIVVAMVLLPLLSSAKSTVIADCELEGIFGQSGSIEITFNDITVKDKTLRTTSTDLQDWWNPNYDPDHGNYGHADYMLEASPTPNNSDYEVHGSAYFGMASVKLTGGKIKRSGTITLEVIPDNDVTIAGRCKLDTQINQLKIEAGIAVESVIKLSPNQDLSGGGVLGRTYTSGISVTNNGHLMIYARN
jgi:hypothetical protein